MSNERQHRDIQRLRRVAHWLDDRFRVPGTNIRFGLDALIGLLPGVGDSVSALWGVYFIGRAHQQGMPMSLKSKMAVNLLIDLIVGAIPIVGDLFDVGFKSHVRNVALLDDFIEGERDRRTAGERSTPKSHTARRRT